jgi:hypothetical protein
MVLHNAQSEAPRTRTNKKTRKPSSDRGQSERIRPDSQDIQGEPITLSRDDRARGNSFNSSGDVPLGGTVQQLITETREEIEEIQNRGEKLHKRLTELEQLLNRLQKPQEEQDS